MLDSEEKYLRENALEVALYEGEGAKFSQDAPAKRVFSVIVIDDADIDSVYDALSEYLVLNSRQAEELIKIADSSEDIYDLLDCAYENKLISYYKVDSADSEDLL